MRGKVPGYMPLPEEFRSVMETASPSLFVRLGKLRDRRRVLSIDRHVDALIEAYPRSGSTYAVSLVECASGDRTPCLASHLHSWTHVTDAVRRDIPTVVLVRNPLDAISSFMVYLDEQRPAPVVRRYARFYHRVERIARDAPRNFHVVSFDDLTARPGGFLRLMASMGVLDLQAEDLVGVTERALSRTEAREVEYRGTLSEHHVGRPSEHRVHATRAARTQVMSVPDLDWALDAFAAASSLRTPL